MRLFIYRSRQQRIRTAVLAAVAAVLIMLSGFYASGALRAADDEGNATVPAFRSFLPAIRIDPTPVATPAPFPRLVNGSLEQGPGVGWTQFPDTLIFPTNTIAGAARGGANSSYVAWLGGSPGLETLAQKVIIPYAFSMQVRLKFYAFTESAESNCSNDTAALYLAENTVPLLRFPLCNGKETNAWQQYTVDLFGYGGKQIELRFVSNLNDSRSSNWFLNRFELCQAGTPGC